MENRVKWALTAIIVIAILVALNLRLSPTLITYALACAIVVTALLVLKPSDQTLSMDLSHKMKRDGGIKLDSKEKKLLTFHILALLEKKEDVDMNELAEEFNTSVYQLNDIVRMLGKHELVTIFYPPMHNFPILRRGDAEKSRKFRLNIFKSIVKGKESNGSKMDEFAKEVEEYLENVKRK
ncbi:MAG: hypothetical protein V1744_01960 [Candidatus Altiarchaeota archaeon]